MTAPPLDAVNNLTVESAEPAQDRSVFVSLTRLRLRSIRFLPAFGVHAVRTRQQCAHAAGFQRGALLMDRNWTFWTLTQWDSQQSMRAYMASGDHKAVMPSLMRWCDEASVAHWNSTADTLPTWAECDGRMRTEGRISKVRNPSPQHADMSFRAPRTTNTNEILPIRR